MNPLSLSSSSTESSSTSSSSTANSSSSSSNAATSLSIFNNINRLTVPFPVALKIIKDYQGTLTTISCYNLTLINQVAALSSQVTVLYKQKSDLNDTCLSTLKQLNEASQQLQDIRENNVKLQLELRQKRMREIEEQERMREMEGHESSPKKFKRSEAEVEKLENENECLKQELIKVNAELAEKSSLLVGRQEKDLAELRSQQQPNEFLLSS